MANIQKLSNVEWSTLFNIYKPLLTEKQREVFELHCDCDCSLSEIAEQLGISRQGVRAAIVNTEKNLLEFERAIHFAEKTQKIEKFLNKIQLELQNEDVLKAKQLLKNFIETEKN